MTHRTRSKTTYVEKEDIDEQSLWLQIDYFDVPKDALIDLGDGWAAKQISYPHYYYGTGWVVDCIINAKYHRVMELTFVLNEEEIVKAYVKYIKCYFEYFKPSTAATLMEEINKEKIKVVSPFTKGDILLYIDAPEFAEKDNARLLIVTGLKDITTFKCLFDYALTTEVTHLDTSLSNSKLDIHSIYGKPGTLQAVHLQLLVSAAETATIGETAAKYKSIAMQKDLELQDMTKRYSNWVKISEQNVKGIFKHFDEVLRKALKEKQVGIVISPSIQCSKSLFRYEVKRNLQNKLELREWKRGKYIEYHKLSLTQLSQITSVPATKREIVKKNAENKSIKYILTWEGARIGFDHGKTDLFIKLNLVRIDPVNKLVIGSNKQKQHEKYLQRKRDKKKAEEEKKKQKKQKENINDIA